MKSLVLFGDSLLGRFGKDLIVELEAKLTNFKVYNCAAGGLNSYDGLQHVAYISTLKPGYVVISFGANDAAPWKKQVELSEYKENMEKIMRSFNGSKIIGFPCPPANDPSDPKLTEEFNKLLVKYNEVFTSLCDDLGADYINLKEVFGVLLKNGHDYHMGDGMHLNEYGYKLLIDKLVQIIKSGLAT